jgi:hypothetical protein
VSKREDGGKVDYTFNCPYAGVPLYTHYTQHSTIYIYDHVVMCTVWIHIRVSSNEKREKKRGNLTHKVKFVRISVYGINFDTEYLM